MFYAALRWRIRSINAHGQPVLAALLGGGILIGVCHGEVI